MARIPKAAQPADAARMIAEHDNRLRQAEARLAGDTAAPGVALTRKYADAEVVKPSTGLSSVGDLSFRRLFTPAEDSIAGDVWDGDVSVRGFLSVHQADWQPGAGGWCRLICRLKNTRLAVVPGVPSGYPTGLAKPREGYADGALFHNLDNLPPGRLIAADATNTGRPVPSGWTEPADTGDVDLMAVILFDPAGYSGMTFNLSLIYAAQALPRTA